MGARKTKTKQAFDVVFAKLEHEANKRGGKAEGHTFYLWFDQESIVHKHYVNPYTGNHHWRNKVKVGLGFRTLKGQGVFGHLTELGLIVYPKKGDNASRYFLFPGKGKKFGNHKTIDEIRAAVN